MLKGTAKFGPEIDAALLPTHLADCLRRRGANDVEIYSDSVAFKGHPCPCLGLLFQFDFGNLVVDSQKRKIRYRLSVRGLMVDCSILVGLMAAFAVFVLIPGTGSLLPIAIIPFMWLWFVGGNLVIGISRFRRFVRCSIATAPRLET